MSEPLEGLKKCIQAHDGDCEGEVEYRFALSATGVSYPRCDKHWAERLEVQRGIEERYPHHQPADFDPSYAGERWDDEY